MSSRGGLGGGCMFPLWVAVVLLGIPVAFYAYTELGNPFVGLLVVLLVVATSPTALASLRRSRSRRVPAHGPPSVWRSVDKTYTRENVPAGMRFDVFQRDGFRCRYCGRSSQDDGVKLHADHVVPARDDGPTTMGNLVTSCQDCNLGKSDKEVV